MVSIIIMYSQSDIMTNIIYSAFGYIFTSCNHPITKGYFMQSYGGINIFAK